VKYEDFLNRTIEDGIAGAKADYALDKTRLDGALRGFEECRRKDVAGLIALLTEAREKTFERYREQADDYWYWRCREAEVEWVCNVVSSLITAMGGAFMPITSPTARGYLKMAEIVRSDGCLTVRPDS